MKKVIMIIGLVIVLVSCNNDDDENVSFEVLHISDFTSILPVPQSSNFIFPSSTHTFQKIIEAGELLSAGGTFPIQNDFTGYVPINGSSTNGYLSISSEHVPGGVTVLDINFDEKLKLWHITASQAVDFTSVGGTVRNCSGTVTPWNTIITCEEYVSTTDDNMDGYNDFGWAIEIDPSTKKVINKRWALGNFAHENIAIHSNLRTVYEGADSYPGYLYKFVADNQKDLSSGTLYVYKGSKAGMGNWIQIDNTTIYERNNTLTQSQDVEATIFNGIEDVEIGPDGMIYFAVKGEDSVYRFKDSHPVNGTEVSMETFVGKMDYTIKHNDGETTIPWGTGNDNLAFDNEGNLWVLQDGGNNQIWVVEKTHTQQNPKVKLFAIAPFGSEPTGITFTPDNNYMFISLQHPANSNKNSFQIDAAGKEVKFDNHISIVISLKGKLGNN